MSQVQKAVEDLITAVKECEEYHRYQKAREKMFQYPVLKEKADEFRRLNYDFQCNGSARNLLMCWNIRSSGNI